ncbi:McrB family protein [Priestia megaterium]|uniref:McrB family protein n=1 Tax=Priestia megaterium TaxID=1404 RepID=UPI00372D3C08
MQMRYELPEIKDTEKRYIEECFLLGKLAEDDSNLPGLGIEAGKAVSYTHVGTGDNVVFYIKVCSDEPLLLKNLVNKSPDEVYITFDNRNKLYLDRENYQYADDKVEFIREHFKNKLILFKPKLNYDYAKKRYHYNFDVILVEEEGEVSTHYVPVPHIKKGISHKRFEKLLLDQKPIELEQHNHSFDTPEFIVCDSFIYQIPDSDSFEKYKTRTTTYICRKPEEIKKIPLPKDWHFSMARIPYKDLCFISTFTRGILIDLFEESGKSIVDSYKEVENEMNNSKEEPKGKKESKNHLDEENNRTEKSDEGNIVEEYEFLDRLSALAEQKELIYDQNDLKNLHISLKTGNLTILGGMSGTGKSELARLYAEALGLSEGENLLFLPVSPSFTEPSDILGFLNQQTGIYMESDTGLTSFLIKASKEKDTMFMVVFDEMNLGQIEHYFSDFISVLEGPRDNRKLKLFSEKSICHQPDYREGIEIGNNVLFVGTMNIDESVKMPTNRILDRSNFLILEKKGFLEAKIYEEQQLEQTEEEKGIVDMSTVIKAENFQYWISNSDSLSNLEDDELKILDEIHEQISNYDSQTGVSFRIAKSVAKYLENIPKDEDGNELLSRDVAFDYQIKQRILPKIRGYRDQIENLIFKIDGEGKIKEGTISMILTKYEEKNFEKSLKYLEQKSKELIRNGYTL